MSPLSGVPVVLEPLAKDNKQCEELQKLSTE